MTNSFCTTPLSITPDDHSKGIDTEWVVITGAPSTGKTTVLQQLAGLGYTCMPELAREIVEKNSLSKAATDIRSDEALFQREVLDAKLSLEASLNPNQKVLLDRGIPDSITYYRAAGLNPDEAVKHCYQYRYKKVFLFERLHLVEDGVRTENDDLSELIQIWLERDYLSIGYDIIFVPEASVSERVSFVLNLLDGR